MYLRRALQFTVRFLVLSLIPGGLYELRAEAITIDNDTPGFSCTSGWTVQIDTVDKYGADYRIDLNAGVNTGLTAIWKPSIAVGGYYRIFMRWPTVSNAPKAAPIEIAYKGGTLLDTTRTVNQSIDGGKWVGLGTYYFSSGENNYVKITGASAGFTLADVVMFVRAETVVVDNLDSGRFTYTGSWSLDSNLSGCYGANFRRDTTIGADTTIAAKWSPVIAIDGYYHIYMRWPIASNAPTAAPLEIGYQGGARIDSTRTVNQTINGGKWTRIGTYYLSAGSDNYIKIRGNSPGHTMADAVMFDLSYQTTTPPTDSPYPAAQNITGAGSKIYVLRDDTGNFSLSNNGELFFAKGYCNARQIPAIAVAGANSVRTYSAEDLVNHPEILPDARAKNIKVLIGLNMPHETISLTYWDNPEIVAQKLALFKSQIELYKNEPALLGWGIGNEVDSLASTNPVAIYEAIQAIARAAHEADPFHPTVSIHAGSDPRKIENIRHYAPDIDLVACNAYRSIGSVESNVTANDPVIPIVCGGWIGGYMITEFSIDQPYEATETSWGAVIEPNSAAKFDTIYNRYMAATPHQGSRPQCVGAFYFSSQDSFRVSHTWYNLFVPNISGVYKATPILDAMYQAWHTANIGSPVPPATFAPQIQNLTLNGSNSEVMLKLGDTVTAAVTATSSDTNLLIYNFELRREVSIASREKAPPIAVYSGASSVAFTLPNDGTINYGNYRLYCYVEDGSGRMGTASLPFRISTAGNSTTVSISTQPINKVAKQGDNNIQFSVTATGSGLVSYQWYQQNYEFYQKNYDYHALPGATASVLTLSNVDVARHSGTYAVAVTDANGTKLSSDVTFEILVQARFASQPANVSAALGDIAMFGVSIDLSDPKVTYPLEYKWMKNGVEIDEILVPTAISRSLLWDPVQATDDGATFAVKATNSVATPMHPITRTVISNSATLTVLTQSKSPVADTYIRSGTGYSDKNFGTEAVLAVRQLTTSSVNDRRAYLRFDLTGLTTVTKAVLYLFPKTVSSLGNASSASHGIAQVAGDGWSETGLNWYNHLTYGTDYPAFTTWMVAPSQIDRPIMIDVTSQVNNAIGSDHLFSVRIFSTSNDGYVEYGSREGASYSRPVLWYKP